MGLEGIVCWPRKPLHFHHFSSQWEVECIDQAQVSHITLCIGQYRDVLVYTWTCTNTDHHRLYNICFPVSVAGVMKVWWQREPCSHAQPTAGETITRPPNRIPGTGPGAFGLHNVIPNTGLSPCAVVLSPSYNMPTYPRRDLPLATQSKIAHSSSRNTVYFRSHPPTRHSFGNTIPSKCVSLSLPSSSAHWLPRPLPPPIQASTSLMPSPWLNARPLALRTNVTPAAVRNSPNYSENPSERLIRPQDTLSRTLPRTVTARTSPG